jgi:hypothetical protein
MGLETNTGPKNQKNVSRVVLVNSKGERLLDTYIKPQHPDCLLKQGIKSSLFNYSKAKAQPIEAVRERFLAIIKGKTLVGYHLPQKIADFGLLNFGSELETITWSPPKKALAESPKEKEVLAPNALSLEKPKVVP